MKRKMTNKEMSLYGLELEEDEESKETQYKGGFYMSRGFSCSKCTRVHGKNREAE